MEFTSTVQAIAGKGLAGDRYALGTGSYSRSKGIRDLTLIEIEGVWDFFRSSGIELYPGFLRRNIVTEGVRLSNLIGHQFSIGSVTLLGLRACPPCLYLAKLTGIPEVLGGFAKTGGLYAQILTDGVIRIDDTVTFQKAAL